MTAQKHWTLKEDDLLERLYRDGKNDDEIAARLPGRTAGAVRLHRVVLGLTQPHNIDRRPCISRADASLMRGVVYQNITKHEARQVRARAGLS